MGSPHLTWKERYQIERLSAEGHKAQVIAVRLGRHRSCIYEELKRGRQSDGRYSADRAQLRRDECGQRSAANCRGKPASIWKEVRYGLKRRWTPEQVTGRFTLAVGRAPRWEDRVSTPAIYAWIRKHEHGLTAHLRRLGRNKVRRRGKRGGALPASRPRIAERPQEVQLRHTFGHWEADSVLGRRGATARLVTLVERKSRYLVMRHVDDGRADTVGDAIIGALANLPVKTLTFDNGSEFAAFEQIERKLDCHTFFADAYSPWQRGSNENCNGLVRDFAPRNRDFSKLSHQFVAAAADNLNHRPRKCLGFRTPHEVLFGLSPVGFRT